jgi:hypothetical protein
LNSVTARRRHRPDLYRIGKGEQGVLLVEPWAGEPMKIAAYNILKGGSQRAHWVKMIEDLQVERLLVQESYPHHEHLPPLV